VLRHLSGDFLLPDRPPLLPHDDREALQPLRTSLLKDDVTRLSTCILALFSLTHDSDVVKRGSGNFFECPSGHSIVAQGETSRLPILLSPLFFRPLRWTLKNWSTPEEFVSYAKCTFYCYIMSY